MTQRDGLTTFAGSCRWLRDSLSSSPMTAATRRTKSPTSPRGAFPFRRSKAKAGADPARMASRQTLRTNGALRVRSPFQQIAARTRRPSSTTRRAVILEEFRPAIPARAVLSGPHPITTTTTMWTCWPAEGACADFSAPLLNFAMGDAGRPPQCSVAIFRPGAGYARRIAIASGRRHRLGGFSRIHRNLPPPAKSPEAETSCSTALPIGVIPAGVRGLFFVSPALKRQAQRGRRQQRACSMGPSTSSKLAARREGPSGGTLVGPS